MLIQGDCLKILKTLNEGSVNCCVTSPPYWGLRDYGVSEQLGLEKSPLEYVERMVEVFSEVRRVLRSDGTLWLNLGDCYASAGGAGWQGKHVARADRTHTQRNLKRRSAVYGLKPKDLVGIPWRVAFALQADGWWLRSEIIWHKSNCLPESVTDRPTKAHEQIFLLAKSKAYFFDMDAIREPHAADSLRRTKRKFVYKHKPPGQTAHTLTPDGFCHPKGKNKRSVWKVSTKPFKGAHFATFPEALIEPCILAGSPAGGTILDPFLGSGTTAVVAHKLGREFVGIELNPAYVTMAEERLRSVQMEMSLK